MRRVGCMKTSCVAYASYDVSGDKTGKAGAVTRSTLSRSCPAGRPASLDKDDQADRAISTGKRTARAAYTPGLSTWWSTTALSEALFRGGFPA